MNDFYSIIRSLKTIGRNGWIERELNADSIAEHNFGAIVLGWMFAHQENADVSKVIAMLTIHDLVMAKMTDVTPASGKYGDKRAMEQEAMKLVIETLSQNVREEYQSLFDEFNEQKTRESHVAKDADKGETLLQGEAFEVETGRNDILDEFLEVYKDAFKTESGKKLYDEIKLRHEERKL